MPKYERLSEPILGQHGNTIATRIRLDGGAMLEILGGDRGENFRLKFGNADGFGWWVTPEAMTQLITELLYIRKEIEAFWGIREEEVRIDMPPGEFVGHMKRKVKVVEAPVRRAPEMLADANDDGDKPF